MKHLPTSSNFDFHVFPKEDMNAYIHRGFQVHKSIGFEGVDLDLYLLESMGENWRACVENMVAMSEEFGIGFPQCHLPFISQTQGEPDPTFDKKIREAIDAAKMMKAEYAVLHPNSVSVPLTQYDPKAQYDRVMSYMSPLVEYADKAGVQILIENMRTKPTQIPSYRYCSGPEELCRVADALGIGVCWDTGHAHISGLCQSEAIKYVGSRLKAVHINDNLADDDIHLPPFTGTVDWADVMKGLAAIGYNGFLNFEVATQKVPAGAREAFGRYIHGTAEELLALYK